MRALITGGTGFIGARLASALLADDAAERLTLLDAAPGADLAADPRVDVVAGDVTDPAVLAPLVSDVDHVWHLAAVVSAAAEADFDLGRRVNVDGTSAVLEALRATGRRPRLVFASSFAVYGGDLPAVVDDEFHATPRTSYGTHKAIGELMVADHSRKGHLDGRSLRLPTVVVRSGTPNRAASTFASSIIRDPLAGRTAVCPVDPGTALYVLSPAGVVDALRRAMALPEDAFAGRRTLPLPGITVTVGEMVDALTRAAGRDAAARIRWQPDPAIERIVAGWPVAATAARARALGFTDDGSIDAIVRAHLAETAQPHAGR